MKKIIPVFHVAAAESKNAGSNVEGVEEDAQRIIAMLNKHSEFNWCEWAAREVTQKFHVQLDRDGEHPDQVTCKCGTKVRPIKLMQYPSKWFYPAHQKTNLIKA
jgi:hypothetical protein